MRNTIIACLLAASSMFTGLPPAACQDLVISSPDKNLVLRVDLRQKIYYSVWHKGNLILSYSPVSLSIKDGDILGERPQLLDHKTVTVDEVIRPPYGRRKEIRDNYNRMTLDFAGNFSVEFRAYNEGVAYRFITRIKGNITVTG